MEEVVELAAVGHRNASFGCVREAVPWNHQAVVWIAGAGNRIAGYRVHFHGVRRIVEILIEYGNIAPQAVIRDVYGLTEAVVYMQLRRHLPEALAQELHHHPPAARV